MTQAPPFPLSLPARAHWNRLLRALLARPWFALELDADLLAIYCQILAELEELEARADPLGEQRDLALKFAEALGLTPLSRARIDSDVALRGPRESWEG